MIDHSFKFEILEFNIEIKKSFKEKIKNWPLTKYSFNKNSYGDKDQTKLLNLIKEELSDFSKKLNILLVETWIQKYQKNNFHDLHIHPGTDYSFVWYIECTEKSSKTVFFSPGYPYIDKHKLEVYPNSGKLILFSSFIPHHVLPNDDETRLIISGNFING